jgi:hypothetical protein
VRIKCQPLYGQQKLDVSGFKGKVWKNGEVRTVADEAQAALLLNNVNFVDADTGVNPYFTCSMCGKFTIDSGAVDHVKRTRVCLLDQEKAHDEKVEAAKGPAAQPAPEAPAAPVAPFDDEEHA